MPDALADLTAALAAEAHGYDISRAWPERCLAAYGAAGGWGWSVPRAYGGSELAPVERLARYVAVARGDMSSALFVTQHDGSVDLIAACENEPLKRDVLPRYAQGAALTTIGYSQLTTSRQSGSPALRARREGGAWVLEGVMPWVTGALHCESVLAGAVLPDGLQVLLLLPLDRAGVEIEPALELLALESTHTSLVRCTAVTVPDALRVAGPEPNVLARRTPVRSLLVSATGIGLLGAMTDLMAQAEARSLPAGLRDGPPSGDLTGRIASLRGRLDGFANWEAVLQDEVDALRGEINDLLMRTAGVLLTLAKGSGFARAHPAQRLVREAMFFCVWSATDSVRAASIGRLLGSGRGDE